MSGYRVRDLGDFFAAQAGFDNHLGGELHSGATLIEPLVHGFAKTAQPTVDVVNWGIEPSSDEKRKKRVANPAMQEWHRTRLNGTTPGRKSAPLNQVEPFSQFFNDLRDLKEIVAGIGIPYEDELAARSSNSSHQCAAVAWFLDHYDSRAMALSDSSRQIGAAIVRHHNFTSDGMFAASLPSFLNATCQRILLVEAGNDY